MLRATLKEDKTMKKAMFKTLICLMLCACMLSAGMALAASAEGDLIRFLPTYITIEDGDVTVEGYFVNLNEDHAVENFTDFEMEVYIGDTQILDGSFGDINEFTIEPLGLKYQSFTFNGNDSLDDDVAMCDDTVHVLFGCGFTSIKR